MIQGCDTDIREGKYFRNGMNTLKNSCMTKRGKSAIYRNIKGQKISKTEVKSALAKWNKYKITGLDGIVIAMMAA